MSNAKPKTARSYRGAMVDDNAIISINIKWLIQSVVVIAGLVYSYVQVEIELKNLNEEWNLLILTLKNLSINI